MGQGMGMGHGMMGSHDHAAGPGMNARYAALDLTDEQRDKIEAIQEELARKQGELMGRMHSKADVMHGPLHDGKLDEKAERQAFADMSAAHQEMFEARLEARKRIDAVLTPEQRKQLGR